MDTAIETSATLLADSDPLALAIARIEDPETPDDELAATVQKLDFFLEIAKELREAFDRSMTQRIKAREDKPVVLGKWLYSLKHPRSTKCVDVPAAVEACLTHCGGDFHQFCTLLSANAIKYGSAKQVLPAEMYEKLFKVEVKDELDRKLAKVNLDFTNFMQQRKAGAT